MSAAPNLARDLLADLAEIIVSPHMTDAKKRDAIRIAYEIGKSEGRVEGAASISEAWTTSLDKVLGPKEVA